MTITLSEPDFVVPTVFDGESENLRLTKLHTQYETNVKVNKHWLVVKSFYCKVSQSLYKGHFLMNNLIDKIIYSMSLQNGPIFFKKKNFSDDAKPHPGYVDHFC